MSIELCSECSCLFEGCAGKCDECEDKEWCVECGGLFTKGHESQELCQLCEEAMPDSECNGCAAIMHSSELDQNNYCDNCHEENENES